MAAILIASAEEPARNALSLALSQGFPLIIVPDQDSTLNALSQCAPINIIFIGTSLCGENGGLIKTARAKHADITIIVVGDIGDEDLAVQMVRCGANGYIMKNFNAQDALLLARKVN